MYLWKIEVERDILKEIFSKSVSQMFDYYRARAEINA